MPDSKISALPSATVPLAGTEVLPIVQSGTTDKVTAADLLRQNGQTVTTSNPVLSLAQTWNAGGVTFTGLLFSATDTASAAGSLLLDLKVAGNTRFSVNKDGGIFANSTADFNANSLTKVGTVRFGSGADTLLTSDAANTLALRNGTNAQTFRLYTTYTDASNYERLSIVGNAGSVFQIITQNAGTGTSRALRFGVGGTGIFDIATTGHLNWVTDNTYDIGASGATRPRTIYAGTGVTAGTYLRVNGTNAGYIALGTADDVVLNRDAADTLALRNGTAAQTFNVYNTYTDASNYERLSIIAQSGNDVRIQTAKAGTGTARSLLLGTDASVRWLIGATSGHFLAGADNTYDIGASGATRPRNVFIGSALTVGTNITMGTGNQISCAGAAALSSVTDGIWLMTNNAGTNFTRLQFGGTTSSFPAITRSGTGLIAQLADGSGRTTFECGVFGSNSTITASGSVTASNGTAIPAGGSASTGFRFSSTANFGVFFGSGAPTLSAAKGSLYLRSDGTTTNDRMYVNTDGSTTWTAVTTAA